MNKYFCSYKQSLALKQLGFNEECIGVYHRDGTLFSLKSNGLKDEQMEGFKTIKNSECMWENDDESIGGIQEVATPLKSQAFEFFRNKQINSTIQEYDINNYCFCIDDGINKDIEIIGFKTYEEAENNCIDKLIEICKNES